MCWCFGCCCCWRTCCSSTGSTRWGCSIAAWCWLGLFPSNWKAFPDPEVGGKLGEMYPESWCRPPPFDEFIPTLPFDEIFSASSLVRIFKGLLLFRNTGGTCCCWWWWWCPGWIDWDVDQCFDRNNDGSSSLLLSPLFERVCLRRELRPETKSSSASSLINLETKSSTNWSSLADCSLNEPFDEVVDDDDELGKEPVIMAVIWRDFFCCL